MIKPFIPSVVTIGPLELHLYGLLIGLGIGIIYIALEQKFSKKLSLWDYILIGVAAFIGARLSFLVNNLDMVKEDLSMLWSFGSGGFVIFGGLIGFLLSAYLICIRKSIELLSFTDTVFLWAPIAQIAGRIGNFINQELYGVPCKTDTNLCLYIEPNKRVAGYESYETFTPIFFYESLLNAINFAVIYLISRRFSWIKGIDGVITAVFMINYAIIRLIMNRFRLDQSYVFGSPIEITDLLSVIMLIAGATLLLYKYRSIKEKAPFGNGTFQKQV